MLELSSGQLEPTCKQIYTWIEAFTFRMLKQTQKAKAQLKRVIAYPWNLEDADYLQQCMFMLEVRSLNQS